MQVKPFLLTIIVFSAIAFLADAWLARSSDQVFTFEQSQLTPIPSRQFLAQQDTLPKPKSARAPISSTDSTSLTRTIAQKLEDLTTAARIEKRLFRSLRALEFEIEVKAGVATISGKVPTESVQQRVVQLARAVRGVNRVEDRMTVEVSGSISE